MASSFLIESRLTHSVIGAFYEVYNTLGYGFLERIYVMALERELREKGHQVSREVAYEFDTRAWSSESSEWTWSSMKGCWSKPNPQRFFRRLPADRSTTICGQQASKSVCYCISVPSRHFIESSAGRSNPHDPEASAASVLSVILDAGRPEHRYGKERTRPFDRVLSFAVRTLRDQLPAAASSTIRGVTRIRRSFRFSELLLKLNRRPAPRCSSRRPVSG